MTFPYRLKSLSLDYVGAIQIQVIESTEPPQVRWQGELPGSEDSDIKLLQPLDQHRFVAVTDRGKVFLGDDRQRTVTPLADLSCRYDSGAWLDTDTGRLWLAADFRHKQLNGYRLLALDLNQGTVVANWPIDDSEHDLTTLTRRHDGQFAFYGRNSKPGYKFRQHWIHCLNPGNGDQQRAVLASKPTPVDVTVRPWLYLDRTRGLALMPGADRLIQVDEDRFAFELQLLDLNQGEVLWTREVRHLHLDQVESDHYHPELRQSLSRIASGQYAHTDNDAWQTLLSCLTGAWFDPTQPEIWLGWQDGTVQKIGLDGERRSPLYRVGIEDSQGNCHSPMPFDHEPLAPSGRQQDRLTLSYGFECDEHLEARLPKTMEAAPLDQRDPQWLPCQRRAGLPLRIPASLQAQPGPSGCVHITSGDLHCAEGRQQALEQLLALLPALQQQLGGHQESQSGWLGRLVGRLNPKPDATVRPLYLAFSDGLGRTESEKQFFHEAVHHQACAPLIAQLIDSVSRWPCAATLEGHGGEPLLAHAAYSLCLNKAYLPQLAAYFCAMGGGEAVSPFHINHTLAAIREHHADTPELATFLAAVPWPYNDNTFTKPERDPYDDWGEDD
ncbi:hypothetical protein [Ferrimonas kyonanensis]|uniref:hypothetical protein n=1 Tax=Ferrimonas kyonanensis TaxID=364763 RepID=UPI0004206C6A|nr:hypothetical protein [Ferrimonas kyonanensis]